MPCIILNHRLDAYENNISEKQSVSVKVVQLVTQYLLQTNIIDKKNSSFVGVHDHVHDHVCA